MPPQAPAPQTNPMPPSSAMPAPEATPAKLPSAFSLFKPSAKAFLYNFWTFVFLWILPVAILVVMMIVLQASVHSSLQTDEFGTTTYNASGSGTAALNIFVLLGGLVAIILLLPITAGYIYAQLKSVRSEKVGFKEAFKSGLHNALKLLGLGIVVGFLVLGGLILLIVPGLIMWRRYALSSYYLIDQNLSIGDAMKKCAEESKKFSKGIWGLIGVQILLVIVSAVPLIGWLFGTVLQIAYFCAPAKRYDEIQKILNPGAETAGSAPLTNAPPQTPPAMQPGPQPSSV